MVLCSRRSGYSTSAHETARTGGDDPARQAARLPSVANAPRRARQGRILGRLGYSQETFLQLEADLREQVLCRDAQPVRASLYGQKYEILGPLTGPNGSIGWVRTIWIILTGETAPRLVALIPAEKP
jgi:hypothetical protein